MAKGEECPKCGEQKFHKKGAFRVCSKCGTRGWFEKPGKPGSGSGKECGSCGKRRLRKLFTVGGVEVHHCYNPTCRATFVI